MKLRPLSTSVFKVAQSLYVKSLAAMILKRWGFLIAVPLIALMWAGVYDYRCLILALMLVFVIYPMLLPIVYINYMLRPEVRAILFPQRVKVGADGRITVEYFAENADEDSLDNELLLPLDRYVPPPLEVAGEDIKDVAVSGGYLKVTIDNPHIFFIFIPTDKIEYLD